MRNETIECREYYFKKLSSMHEQQYDYTWWNEDSYRHRHMDFYEIFFMAGGTATHYYEGKEQQIHKNWLFFFRPGEEHWLYTKSFESFHFSFFAMPEFFNRFFEEHPTLKGVFGQQKYLSYEMNDTEFEYINLLANSLTHQADEYEKVSLLLYNMISLLKLNNGASQGSKENLYVAELVRKLNNFTYLTCKVQDIYKEYPIARCTLIREFKNYTGMTIVQYQRKQKLAYASQLLINSAYSVSEIADILEFESLSHFLRIFREQYGMTPKEYRKTHMHS